MQELVQAYYGQELTGTADVQYEEWREILKQIYIEETGLPARKDR